MIVSVQNVFPQFISSRRQNEVCNPSLAGLETYYMHEPFTMNIYVCCTVVIQVMGMKNACLERTRSG